MYIYLWFKLIFWMGRQSFFFYRGNYQRSTLNIWHPISHMNCKIIHLSKGVRFKLFIHPLSWVGLFVGKINSGWRSDLLTNMTKLTRPIIRNSRMWQTQLLHYNRPAIFQIFIILHFSWLSSLGPSLGWCLQNVHL